MKDDDALKAQLHMSSQRMQTASDTFPHLTAVDQVSERARFEARAFVARWERETGETLRGLVRDRVLFAFEIGFSRGHTNGMQAFTDMIDELKKKEEMK